MYYLSFTYVLKKMINKYLSFIKTSIVNGVVLDN